MKTVNIRLHFSSGGTVCGQGGVDYGATAADVFDQVLENITRAANANGWYTIGESGIGDGQISVRADQIVAVEVY